MATEPALRTLAQTFRFPGADAAGIARLLATAPLVGEESIFGQRAGRATSDGGVRRLLGFEPVPVPLLRFDVALRQEAMPTGLWVLVEFTQPGRRRPYLEGQFVWLLSDITGATGAELREEINTPAALEIVDRPLHGHRFSFRRSLFFAGGHRRLVRDVVANIRTLLESDRG